MAVYVYHGSISAASSDPRDKKDCFRYLSKNRAEPNSRNNIGSATSPRCGEGATRDVHLFVKQIANVVMVWSWLSQRNEQIGIGTAVRTLVSSFSLS